METILATLTLIFLALELLINPMRRCTSNLIKISIGGVISILFLFQYIYNNSIYNLLLGFVWIIITLLSIKRN